MRADTCENEFAVRAEQRRLDRSYNGAFLLVLLTAVAIAFGMGYQFIVTVVVAVAWLSTAIIWTGNLACWANTIRLLGVPRISDCFRMLWIAKIARFGPHRLHFFRLPVLIGIFGLLWLGELAWGVNILGTSGLVALTALAFSMKGADYSHRMRPPVVFVLGKSDRDVVAFHARLFYETKLIRIVSLLDIGTDFTDVLFQVVTPRDCLRTTDGSRWREVVRELMRISPIIVIDSRFSTEAVVHEVLQVHSPEVWFKVILLVGPNGEKPAFTDAVAQRGQFESPVFEAPVESAIRVVQQATGADALMPTAECPISLIAARARAGLR